MSEVAGSWRRWFWLAVAILLLVVVWAVWPWAVATYAVSSYAPAEVASAARAASEPHTVYGPLGDTYGALNALFAGLAFVGVAFAGWTQHRQLVHQREETEAARDDAEKSRAAAAGQVQDQLYLARAQYTQSAFESLFFQLLSLFRELQSKSTVSEVQMGLERSPVSSRALAQQLRREIDRILTFSGNDQRRSDMLVALYAQVQSDTSPEFGPMFSSLRELLELIESAEVSRSVKSRYARIVLSVLTSDFILLVQLHCAGVGSTDLLKQVIYHGLLDRSRWEGEHVDIELGGFLRRKGAHLFPSRDDFFGGGPARD